MRYITPDAANDYMQMTWTSMHHGIIGRTHFMERLGMLRRLADPQDGTAQYANFTLSRNEWFEREKPEVEVEPSDRRTGSGPGSSDADLDEDGYLTFSTHAAGLNNWRFHLTDDDPFPSIPHGHEHGRKQHKLDPYLGWIYRRSKQERRLERWRIVELWNDEPFRSFAAAAIEYYLDAHPLYGDWRVGHPRRLPRRRKL
jgi:hypothetical protein